MMVETSPSSSFEVAEPHLLLELLVVAFDAPAQLGVVDQWLTTLLYAQTIAREDGANLPCGRLARPDLRGTSTATHPTRPTLPEGASEPFNPPC
jgi:hypothetical protein